MLGIVLLIGMVAAGSIGILLVAGDSISEIEHESEQERIESAFVELSQQMASSSSNSDVPRTMDMDIGDSGAVVMSDTGSLRIQGGDVDKEIPIGAIEYTSDDGTKIAYQAGGVFRETGAETRVVSAPPVQYDADSETLSFPIIKTRGETELNSGDLTVTHHNTDPLQDASLVENDSVTIEVRSDYYRGWEDYFEQQGGATTVQDVDPENRTVRAVFGYDEIENAFDSGVSYNSDDFHDGHDHFDDPESSVPFPPLDSTINPMIADAKDGGTEKMEIDQNLSEEGHEETLSEGTYFIEEIQNDDELSFDISEGNATLIVEGDIVVGDAGHIRVDDWSEGNSLKIYSGGDQLNVGGEICVDDCRKVGAQYIQIYGTSEMRVDSGPGGNQGGTIEGLLYVAADEHMGWWDGDEPNGRCGSEHQVIMQAGDEDFYGSIVAYSICAHSNGMEFEYDEDLKDAEIDIYPESYPLPPQITYLNVAEHIVDVEGN
uniref:DUF7289 family protein n=1 Tax=Natronorubrum texcoconense TaxID=1095776 RepID=UPI000B7D98D9|nr:hypothetical protein [Natronorubrum texcoconense]